MRGSNNPSWSQEELDLLVQLLPTGLTARQISGKLPGRTRNAVIGQTHRMGLKFPSTRVRYAAKKVVRMPKPRASTEPRANASKKIATDNVVKFVDKEHRVKENVVPRRLSELPACGCRFPVRRGVHGEWEMCADQRTHGYYCEDHARECYRSGQRAAAR